MKDDFNTTGHSDLRGDQNNPASKTLTVDVEKYQEFLDGSDMSAAQKEEFLQALWTIIVNFVDLGFGVHPVQEVCGKDAQCAATAAIDPSDEVDSEHTKNRDNPLDSVPKDSLDVE